MNLSPNQPCPCHSGDKYKRCCRPLHRGLAAPTPQALMRSRFAAFAGGLAKYVMDTTHPLGSALETDRAAWEASIQAFSSATEFRGLAILETSETKDSGVVLFRADLMQGSRDASFTERSRFRKHAGRWAYSSGEILEP